MSDFTDVEVILTLAVPMPAEAALREEIYGTTDMAECVQSEIDNDPVAMLQESTLVNVQVGS